MNAPFVPPPSDSQAQRWRRWVNLSGEDCPAFGCVQIGKHRLDPVYDFDIWRNHRIAVSDSRAVLMGYKPDQYAVGAGEPALFGFNADATVPAGSEGWLTQDYPARFLHNGTIHSAPNGTAIGPSIGNWWCAGAYETFWVVTSHGRGRFEFTDGTYRIHDAVLDRSTQPVNTAALFYSLETGSFADGANLLASDGMAILHTSSDPSLYELSQDTTTGGIDGAIIMTLPGVYYVVVSAKVWCDDPGTADMHAYLSMGLIEGSTLNPTRPSTESESARFYAGRVHFRRIDQPQLIAHEMVSCPAYLDFGEAGQGFTIRLNHTPVTSGQPYGGIYGLNILVNRVGNGTFGEARNSLPNP